MLKRVVITNYLGESMEYKIDGVEVDNPSGLIITSIDGLGPGKATVNMTDISTTDGRLYNSARLTGRNIVIKALFTHATSIEEARLLSYKYFPIKKKVHILIETDSRIAETDGYVESNEPDIFSDESGCQISILCEDAFLSDASGERIAIINNYSGGIINYRGDYDTGIKMEINVPDGIRENPRWISEIDIVKDNEHFIINSPKMLGLVPNTSPQHVDNYRCSFLYSCDSAFSKFFKRLPVSHGVHESDSAFIRYEYTGEGVDKKALFYLHILSYGNEYTTNVSHHYSIYLGYSYVENSDVHNKYIFYKAPDDTEWESLALPTLKFGNTPSKLYGTFYMFKNTIYIEGEGAVQEYDPINDEWIRGFDFPYYFKSQEGYITEINGELHIFGGNWSTNRYDHYKLVRRYMHGGETYYDTWEYVDSNVPNDILNGGGASYSYIAVPNNKDGIVYFLHNYLLYTWSAATGYTIESTLQFSTYGSSAIYSREYEYLLTFGGANNEISNKVKWYIGDDVWDEWNTLPYPFDTKNADGQFAIAQFPDDFYYFSDLMFLIGSDVVTGSYSELPNNMYFINGDTINIYTEKGKKSINLIRGDEEYNIINTVGKTPSWFQLFPGDNNFSFTTQPEGTAGNIPIITVNFKNRFQGV